MGQWRTTSCGFVNKSRMKNDIDGKLQTKCLGMANPWMDSCDFDWILKQFYDGCVPASGLMGDRRLDQLGQASPRHKLPCLRPRTLASRPPRRVGDPSPVPPSDGVLAAARPDGAAGERGRPCLIPREPACRNARDMMADAVCLCGLCRSRRAPAVGAFGLPLLSSSNCCTYMNAVST